MTLKEISEASRLIQEEAHDEANILFGAVIDDTMNEDIRVTVIATGFDKPLTKMTGFPWKKVQTVRPAAQTSVASYNQQQPAQQETITAHPRMALKEDGSTVEVSDYVVTKRQLEEQPVRLKDLIQEIGLQGFQEDEYDVPTFLRKQAD